MMQKRILITFFLLALILLTFLPRLLSLSAHWLSDENLWMQRSGTFILALEKRDFASTLTAYHPGVTTTWLGSAAIWGASDGHPVSDSVYAPHFLSPDMLAQIRFPIAYLTGILILISGGLLYRLCGRNIAAIATLFLAIEPFLLAESRRVHTDALTAVFLFLTLLFWLCYLEGDTYQRRDLVYAGICFGLACLTKSYAGGLLIFLPLLLFSYTKQRRLSGQRILMSALLFAATALLTALSLWPYLWTFTLLNIPILPLLLCCGIGMFLWSCKKLSTQSSFSRTELTVLGAIFILMTALVGTAAFYVLSRMSAAFTNAHEWPKLFLGSIRYNPGTFYYFVMGFVWSAPLTIPLILLTTYKGWKQRHLHKKMFRITTVMILFAVFYFIGLTLTAKKIARYLVIIMPMLSTLAAIGAIYLMQYFSKHRIRYGVMTIVVIFQVLPVLQLHPYYVTYRFPLLSGEWVSKNTSVGGGVGLDIAAAYLNAKPNAENLNVRVSLFATGLHRYFIGNTWKRQSMAEAPQNISFHYDVEYVRARQIQGVPVDSPSEKGKPYAVFKLTHDLPRELEYVVRLNGIDYVWIYRVL